jgi:hypothetical protein
MTGIPYALAHLYRPLDNVHRNFQIGDEYRPVRRGLQDFLHQLDVPF